MFSEDFLVYESYLDCKMTKRTITKECLELMHIDMYVTFSVNYGEGMKNSRFGYVHRKSNALHTFIEFKAGSGSLLGIHTKSL